MANPAKDLRDRAQQRWPGATVDGRGRTWLRHAHPTEPGKFALDASIGPIHYGAGENQEIDTAWLPSGDPAFQWAMVENDYHAHSRNVFNAGNLIRYTHAASGLWVQFDPQSLNWRNQDNAQHQIAIKQAVAAVVDDDVLRWPAAWGAGRHFQFQAQTGRLQKLLTVDSAADLPAPTVTGDIALELEYSLSIAAGLSFWIDGVEWQRANGVRVTTGNHIECRNSGGDVLFYIAPPRAWDSDGNETGGLLQVRRDGGPNALFVNVRIPRVWIETAVFPIFVDPTITDGPGGDVNSAFDTYTRQDTPTTDYSASTLISTRAIDNATLTRVGLIKFDLSSLSGATITSATMSLFNFEPQTAGRTGTVRACRIFSVNSGWLETATWDYADGSSASQRWGGDTGNDGGSDAGCSISDTDWSATVMDSQTWGDDASGTQHDFNLLGDGGGEFASMISANYGIALSQASGSWNTNACSSDHGTTGYRPKLVVEYTTGAATLSVTIDPTTTTKSGVRIWG